MTPAVRQLRVVSLFSGIGGLDAGLGQAGHEVTHTCEIDVHASSVLRARLPDAHELGDICRLESLPKTDLVTSGFPCQDISLAGTRAGLAGKRSGLAWKMMALLEKSRPELVLVENVANILRLKRGQAMLDLLVRFNRMRYRWAYRLVDTRGFGIPQRRLRVVLLASRGDIDPAAILFRQSVQPHINDALCQPAARSVYGFYWTEGRRGIGWARDAVPTIKGGSGLGIPSPPAIFFPRRGSSGWAGTPTLADAERLQGFRRGWTAVRDAMGKTLRAGVRWRLLGNAVSVPLSTWIGRELAQSPGQASTVETRPWDGSALPPHALGRPGAFLVALSTTHVSHARHVPLARFLQDEVEPLSHRALTGYLHRISHGDKTLPPRFVRGIAEQLRRTPRVRRT